MVGPVGGVLTALKTILDVIENGDGSDGVCVVLDPPVCESFVGLGGTVTWDQCAGDCGGANGQLWANLQSIDPITGESSAGSCQTYLWTAEVGVVRCVATVNDAGEPPSGFVKETDAQQQGVDADLIFQALTCCKPLPENIADVELVSWSPLGPNGGCAGGVWTVRGALSVCC